ncbi:hypothetical protein TWF696_002461 [Orbilia brochopaga]|uniref:alpha-glucosidase n=1 Tax=Orbilia brochopaga TaxID=3140254 RepID=A0AAV9U4J7_9PEZI
MADIDEIERIPSDTVALEHSIVQDEEAPHGHYEFLEPETQDLPPDKSLATNPVLSKAAYFVLLKDKTKRTTKYGPLIDLLKLEASPYTAKVARIRITDLKKQRWEIPHKIVPLGKDRPGPVISPESQAWISETCYDAGNEGFVVMTKDDPNPIPVFDCRGCPISYYDHYLEISTKLPENTYVYGLGEVTGPFLREPGSRYAFWARDAQTPLHENAYSSLPIFLAMHKGKAFGVYLHNSNALDMVYTESKITWKVVGGILDFFVYTGPTYEDVIRQHQHVIGYPRLPPYWALGYHQCRWFYDTTEKLHESRTKNLLAEIPVDAFWLDIDYMDKYKLFTIDHERYPDFIKYVHKEMRAHNHKLVAIMDPGVKCAVPGYKPWTRGVELDIFIKNGNSQYPRDFVGKVWPGHVVFPDWTHPKVGRYWDEMFKDWLEIMPVDGIWHDMNECSNFVNGDVWEIGGDAAKDEILIPTGDETVDDMAKASAEQAEKTASKTADKSTSKSKGKAPASSAKDEAGESATELKKDKMDQAFDPSKPIGIRNPPYSVNHGGKDLPLNSRSIAVESLHYKGVREYELHNLFGHLNCKTTYETLTRLRPKRRPFILTRSAFAGTGKYASKWLGDNFSTWESMKLSISGILNMQIFGIPHIGADIGGFSDIPSEELLIRWFQLGSMYPFCRNHNMPNTPSQEAHISESVAKIARRYLTLRYRLLPFWYTEFASVSNVGGSVIQPVWAIYPPQKEEDVAQVMLDNNDTFLVGKRLLIIPVVEEGATSVRTWIPAGIWYDILTGETVASKKDQWLDIETPLERMPVYLRGGTILPTHVKRAGKTTDDFRAGGLSLLIALDEDGAAEGRVCIDDGMTINCQQTWVKFKATLDEFGTKVKLSVEGQFRYDMNEFEPELTVREVAVLGMASHVDLKLIPQHFVLWEEGWHTIDL